MVPINTNNTPNNNAGAQQPEPEPGPSTQQQPGGQGQATRVNGIKIYDLQNNSFMSDLKFVVGPADDPTKQGRYHGHKFIFAIKSPVFWTMFNSGIRLENDEVVIPDSMPPIFELFMDFIYQGNKLRADPETGAFDSMASLDDIVDLKYLANKYMVEDLSNECSNLLLNILRKEVHIENALKIWKEIMAAGTVLEGPATKFLEDFIDRSAEFLTNNIEFLDIDVGILTALYKRDTLQVRQEIDLFQAAIRWAQNKCILANLKLTPENIRQQLGPALYQVRYLAIDFYMFSKHVCVRNVLTEVETNKIISCMNKALVCKDAEQRSQLSCEPFNLRRRPFSLDCLQMESHISTNYMGPFYYGLKAVVPQASGQPSGQAQPVGAQLPPVIRKVAFSLQPCPIDFNLMEEGLAAVFWNFQLLRDIHHQLQGHVCQYNHNAPAGGQEEHGPLEQNGAEDEGVGNDDEDDELPNPDNNDDIADPDNEEQMDNPENNDQMDNPENVDQMDDQEYNYHDDAQLMVGFPPSPALIPFEHRCTARDAYERGLFCQRTGHRQRYCGCFMCHRF